MTHMIHTLEWTRSGEGVCCLGCDTLNGTWGGESWVGNPFQERLWRPPPRKLACAGWTQADLPLDSRIILSLPDFSMLWRNTTPAE